MMLWAATAALTLLILALMLVPLLRPARAGESRRSFDIAVYRDQLKELDRDIDRGLMAPEEAEAARTEVERRLLAAVEIDNAESSTEAKGTSRAPLLAGAIAICVAGGTVAIYLALGNPGMQDRPFAERQTEVAQQREQASEMARLTDQLRQRLAQNPEDVTGWALLGRSYVSVDRFDDAADAFRRASELDKTDPDLAASLGEAIVFANNGDVIGEARKAFEAALSIDPYHYKSRFFIAVAKAQAGDEAAALQDWVDLVAISPEGAPWVVQVQAHIDATAAKIGVNPTSLRPTEGLAPPAEPAPLAGATGQAVGPNSQQVEDAAEMTAEQRSEMVNTMVARLAERMKENPDDLEGWLRLGRSYQVLSRHEDAVSAFARAADIAKTNKDVLTEYASAMLAASDNADKVPVAMIPVLERIKAIDPVDTNALWYLGLADNQAGRFDKADENWDMLLKLVPPDSVSYEGVSKAINDLRAKR
ncbi:MAG: c-type cytochrome biogenesis protein CcmI [Rhodospirillales bacterium]|nr:c-type cytochrome biogenesis protein CcmI [Rhodospirillales bacterium]